MTKAREKPSIVPLLRDLVARVGLLERRTSGVITPVPVAGVTVTSTSATAVHMALINPVGSLMTWWVRAVPSAGATVTLRLRADDGTLGVSVSRSTTGIVAVPLALPAAWTAGDQHLIYLDALVNTGSATIAPVRSLIG